MSNYLRYIFLLTSCELFSNKRHVYKVLNWTFRSKNLIHLQEYIPFYFIWPVSKIKILNSHGRIQICTTEGCHFENSKSYFGTIWINYLMTWCWTHVLEHAHFSALINRATVAHAVRHQLHYYCAAHSVIGSSPTNACMHKYMFQNGSAVMLAAKRPMVWHQRWILRHPLHTSYKVCKQGIHHGFETEGRCHQKSKTGVSVAPQKGLVT